MSELLPSNMNYRSDIDGLRAVAVISVIIFHINEKLLPGGFVGVDIFFVISGFLITRIICKDLDEKKFSISWFYLKRIRRILPVFYLVVFGACLCGAFLLTHQDIENFSTSVRYSLFFGANIYFAKDNGYFDIASEEKPLLHIWSLSIEEQFYFVWPFVLLAFSFLSRWPGAFRYEIERSGKQIRFWGTLILVLLAYCYTQFVLLNNSNTSKFYFTLQTRFGEILIGAIVAQLPVLQWRWLRHLFSYGGISAIFLAMFFYSRSTIFPGLSSLLPCVGAGLIIYSGCFEANSAAKSIHDRPMPNRVLGWGIIPLIGLLSYSLYLWHWPILSFMRYVLGSYELPLYWWTSSIVLTVGLSLLSYNFIEKKSKMIAPRFSRAVLFLFLVPAMGLLALTYGIEKMRSEEVSSELASYGSEVCHGTFEKKCRRGAEKGSAIFLMVGDSHAAHLNEFIDVVARHEGWTADIFTASSCSPVFDYDEKVLPEYAQKPCAELKSYVRNNYSKYDGMIVASFWANQLNMLHDDLDPLFFDKLSATIAEVAKSIPVYIVSDSPRIEVHPFRQRHLRKVKINISRKNEDEITREANKRIKELVKSISNVYWVDLSDFFEGLEDRSSLEGEPVYFDLHHLNMYGSKSLGNFFINRQKKFFIQK